MPRTPFGAGRSGADSFAGATGDRPAHPAAARPMSSWSAAGGAGVWPGAAAVGSRPQARRLDPRTSPPPRSAPVPPGPVGARLPPARGEAVRSRGGRGRRAAGGCRGRSGQQGQVQRAGEHQELGGVGQRAPALAQQQAGAKRRRPAAAPQDPVPGCCKQAGQLAPDVSPILHEQDGGHGRLLPSNTVDRRTMDRSVRLPPGEPNGLAGSAGAASGTLHPDADRPCSRPPGQIPRCCRAASRALRVPAGPPAAALDPDPGCAGRRPRRPPGGRRRGRPASSPLRRR